MILTKLQAGAVYRAMCELNNVGAVSSEFDLQSGVWVQCSANGSVQIAPEARFAKWESYPNQADFANAYGI